MTWRHRTTTRILLLLARLLAPAEWKEEVKTLSTHINVTIPKEDPEA